MYLVRGALFLTCFTSLSGYISVLPCMDFSSFSASGPSSCVSTHTETTASLPSDLVSTGLGRPAKDPIGVWGDGTSASFTASADQSSITSVSSALSASVPTYSDHFRPRMTNVSSALGAPSGEFGGQFLGGSGHTPFPAFMAPGPRPMRHFSGDGFYHAPPYYPYPWQPQGYGSPWWGGCPPMQGSFPSSGHSQGAYPPLPPASPPRPPLPPTPPVDMSSERDSTSSVYEEDLEDGDEHEEEFSYSFSDAVSRLAIVSPDSIGVAPETKSSLSAAERALGRVPKSSLSSRLQESTMVAEAFRSAEAKARGEADAPLPGSIPEIPNALSLGNFLKPIKPPQKIGVVANPSFPVKPVPLTQDDLSLLGEASVSDYKGVRSLTLKDKQAQEFIELASRGLESTSVIDTFLGGLVEALNEPSAPSFVLREEIDTDSVVSFIQAISENLKFVASSFSTLQVNLTLCRRDGLLSRSPILKKSQSTQSSLRVVPVCSTALFGGSHIQPTIHSLAESRRDLAFVLPRQSARAPFRSADRGPQNRRSSSSQSASSFRHSSPRARGGRSSSFSAFKKPSSKPYERRQAPKTDSKPSPQ